MTSHATSHIRPATELNRMEYAVQKWPLIDANLEYESGEKMDRFIKR